MPHCFWILLCFLLCVSHERASGSDEEALSIHQQGDAWQLLLFSEALSWQAAEQACIAHGGHLVSISSEPEEDAVERYCFSELATDKCWIGLNDLQDEGHFVFTDATPYNYTKWYTAPWSRKWASEPNDGRNWAQEDCVLLARKDLGWHDEHCNGAHPFICKRPTPPPPAAAGSTTGNATSSSSSSSASSSSTAASRSATHHQLLWGLLGGVVGGLIAFEAVYLTVLVCRKRGGSWSNGRRPSSFDAVSVVKQVEMRSIVDDEMPDLGDGAPSWREAVGDSVRGLWAKGRSWFKGYSELPS